MNEIFVGRKTELEEFRKVIEDPRGQAIIVTGNRGMGKTWLVNKIAKLAGEHPNLKCGCVRYEITPTDSPDSTMAIMMDNAFEAGQIKEGSFSGTEKRLEQWRSLLNVLNLGDLVLSMRRDPAKDTRQQFLERLELISKQIPENGRAVFIVDPEKYMAKESDQTWAIVIKSLPEKIKLVFAQRTEDTLVGSEVIDRLKNVVRIPDNTLEILSEEDVDVLINCRQENLKVEISDLRKFLKQYKGHPYAVGASLDLVEQGTKLEELPKKGEPTEFVAKQWEKINEKGDEAIELFEAYAILEVAVPDDVLEFVSEVNSTTRKRLQNDKYLRGLLRDEANGKRIYHSILADYVLRQMNGEEKKKYHDRTIEIYREILRKAKETQTKPDELAVTRLPEHILESEGKENFVIAFINECFKPLFNLGLFDEAINFSERSIKATKKDSIIQSIIFGNLGLIYRHKCELDKSEDMNKKSLAINEKHGRLEGMLSQYGNLGLIYQTRGELDKAEEMYKKSLAIAEKFGRLEEISGNYGNLGRIYITRGELYRAEEMYEKSLAINEKLKQIEGMSRDYCHLGLIYETRGELDKAEEMQKKSLEINKRLGWLEGIASAYGNLGNIYQTKGELDKAEEMLIKTISIDEKLGQIEGIAIAYGSLGLIYRIKGEIDRAEEMHRKSLEINEKYNFLEGMARDCGNLGLIYQNRGDLENAENMHKKSLEINKKLRRLEGLADQYGNLGIIYQTRGELDKAKEMFNKVLKIEEKLGRLKSIATAYGNLGLIYQKKDELDKAKEMHRKSLEVAEKLGLQEIMAKECGNLGIIYQTQGDLKKTREYWEKAKDLFGKMGIPYEVKKLERWLEKLGK